MAVKSFIIQAPGVFKQAVKVLPNFRTTLMASTNAALPKVSYVKSIDVYLGACFFLVQILSKTFFFVTYKWAQIS
jgi:hypothetical protein